MSTDTSIAIYYGPLSWFQEATSGGQHENLLEVVYEFDEARRRITHTVEGQPLPEQEEVRRLESVVAESGDFASLQEHVITNFAGLVNSLKPKLVFLHNPPLHVHKQLERVFVTTVERYQYPAVTLDTLARFRDGFADQLVGQVDVKEAMLASLYPLTTDRHKKPVVLMFYGPSGVGKTETAQFVNGLLGGELLRKQFSMFHSDKFASYLFGGSHSEASFARDLLDRGSGVILIDEFDKANSVFHSAFYQLFDDGVFEDKNYRVELGRSLFICTSNYGSENEIREVLGDALYSRFDAMIRFEPLTRDEIRLVIERLVSQRFERLSAEEALALDKDEIRALLSQAADRVANVRKLGKTVDGVIALKLVRAALNGRLAIANDKTQPGDTGSHL